MSAGAVSCTLALPVVSSSSVSVPVPAGFSLLANLSQQEQEVAAAAALARSAAADLHGLLPELNGADLAMSLSPKQHHQPHTTPFSVTDILSPIEESYRKLELSGSGAPPSPYRSSTGGSSAGSSTGGGLVSNAPTVPSPGGTATAVMAANPYMHVGQLSHHQFPTQYCNGSDISTHYGDMRNSAAAAAGWYGATANDPRFASK